MDLTADFSKFQQDVSKALVGTIRTTNQIADDDLSFHRSSSTKASGALDGLSSNLLQLTNKLLKAATQDTNIKIPRVKSLEGLDDNWRGVVDVVDNLLEKADIARDEYSGVIRKQTPDQDGTATPPLPRDRSRRAPGVFDDPSMRKPQLDFLRPVDNFTTAPFKPVLQRKPHAKVSLDQSIGDGQSGKYDHPYAYEIEHSDYPPATYVKADPSPYTPPDDSQATFVDTGEALHAMLAELKQAKEIAIDLEHHDMHSYIGLVCLMQISTRDKDWIVDTLRPWREELQILNQVFADPNILKVFHGSNMDMIWLQRDLGLYVVGLFDTFHACCALNFPRRGLAYLLERFVNFHAEKKYQLADWRIRPLPKVLRDYARSDTHYLLYVYDHLRNMLVEQSTPEQNLVRNILEASKQEALQVYTRPIYDHENGLGSIGWYKPLMQRGSRLDNQQFAVFRAVHQWRDQKARSLDEGEQYIMPVAALWILAENMPTKLYDLQLVLRPMPRLWSQKGNTLGTEVMQVIRDAKKSGLEGMTVAEIMQKNRDKVKPNSWERQARRMSPSGLTGVGATLQMLKSAVKEGYSSAAAESANSESLSAGRCVSSHLWGAVAVNTNPTVSQNFTAVAEEALRSVLPLPPLSAITSIDPFEATTPPQEPIHYPTSPLRDFSQNTAAAQDDLIVLRDAVKLRKRKEPILDAPDLPESTADTVKGSLNVPSDPILQARIKQHEKGQRKAEKLRRRAEREAASQQSVETNHAPFDYANAKSLLQPTDPHLAANGLADKVTNPYLKALDTSTGAKRLKQSKEQAGRSMTFRS